VWHTVLAVRLRVTCGPAILTVAVLAGCGDGRVTLPHDQKQPRCPYAIDQAQAPPTVATLRGETVVTLVIYGNCKP
jgi:hypothetical protein